MQVSEIYYHFPSVCINVSPAFRCLHVSGEKCSLKYQNCIFNFIMILSLSQCSVKDLFEKFMYCIDIEEERLLTLLNDVNTRLFIHRWYSTKGSNEQTNCKRMWKQLKLCKLYELFFPPTFIFSLCDNYMTLLCMQVNRRHFCLILFGINFIREENPIKMEQTCE